MKEEKEADYQTERDTKKSEKARDMTSGRRQ